MEEFAAIAQKERRAAVDAARKKRLAQLEAARAHQAEQQANFDREVEEAIAAGKPPPVQLTDRERRLKQIRDEAKMAAQHKQEEEELHAQLEAMSKPATADASLLSKPATAQSTLSGKEGDQGDETSPPLTADDGAATLTALVIDDDALQAAEQLASPSRQCSELSVDPVLETSAPISWSDWWSFVSEMRANFGRELALLLEWR